MKSIVLAHGGVGTKESDRDGCRQAVEVGFQSLGKGVSPLEAAVEAAVVLEEDERFNAGFGSHRRADGDVVEMDASVMSHDGTIGAVAAVQGFRNPVRLAYEVWKSPHVLLAGEGAHRFASMRGMEKDDRKSEKAQRDYDSLMEKVGKGKLKSHPLWKDYSLGDYWNYRREMPGEFASDTIGVIVRNDRGQFAVANSTGGAGTMMMGRVGDTPLVGSGFYVGKVGAVMATGLGEYIIDKLLSFRGYMELEKGRSPQEVCRWAVDLYPEEVPIGLLAVTSDGWGAASNWEMAHFADERSK